MIHVCQLRVIDDMDLQSSDSNKLLIYELVSITTHFFSPLEKRKLDKKPILLERDDILKQELDQDVDSILSGKKKYAFKK